MSARLLLSREHLLSLLRSLSMAKQQGPQLLREELERYWSAKPSSVDNNRQAAIMHVSDFRGQRRYRRRRPEYKCEGTLF